jgi:hypothetical protein
MVNVVDITLANHGVFTRRHARDVEVASVDTRRPMGSHPLLE